MQLVCYDINFVVQLNYQYETSYCLYIDANPHTNMSRDKSKEYDN